ncbi:MAG TPA: DUF4126 family protein [Terriglobales bacterium]|nr:DUF4126 family protein [Terriglobales bacterium]
MGAMFAIFLLGFIDGLRSLTAPAIVCWAAHFGWLHFAGTKLAFLEHPVTLILVTLLALGELVADKLPNTPARTASLGLTARIVLGAACGAAIAIAKGLSLPVSAVVACIGAVAGTFAGYNVRHSLVTRAHLPDRAVALGEDLFAILGGLILVSHHLQG